MNKKNCFEYYVVAFVDVLGAKELIETEKGFDIIRREYQRTIDNFKNKNKDKKYDMGVKIFSDNILFYLKVPQYEDPQANFENRTLHIMKLGLSVKFFQNCLLLKNILVRGGITYGEFHKDEAMVWGKALMRAYELESKIAIYPRIVLDPQLEIARTIFNDKTQSETDAICKDIDGLEFLNFISPLKETKTDFEKIYKYIENEIQRNKTKDNIVQKYKWLKNHLDRIINLEENKNEQ